MAPPQHTPTIGRTAAKQQRRAQAHTRASASTLHRPCSLEDMCMRVSTTAHAHTGKAGRGSVCTRATKTKQPACDCRTRDTQHTRWQAQRAIDPPVCVWWGWGVQRRRGPLTIKNKKPAKYISLPQEAERKEGKGGCRAQQALPARRRRSLVRAAAVRPYRTCGFGQPTGLHHKHKRQQQRRVFPQWGKPSNQHTYTHRLLLLRPHINSHG